jgi:hypothetical protein
MTRFKWKSLFFLLLIFVATTLVFAADQTVQLDNGKQVVLHDDYTWEYVDTPKYDYDFSSIQDNVIPAFLRTGIGADAQTIKTAVEMYLQGWRYTMPVPKSAKAAWGYYDGRTTWFYGYWYNIKTKDYSKEVPVKKANGYYYGDGQNVQNYWRNGGSPRFPTKIEWLLSSEGGVKPVD